MSDSNAATPFSVRLQNAVADTGAPVCVGLDPDLNRLPPSLVGTEAERLTAFCLAITESTRSLAAAYKPNLAFFEALGPDGADVLATVCDAVRATGRLLVLDGKRGDIGNTGQRYASTQYDRLGADAATVAPYMGADSLAPFLAHAGRCAFVLVATSNPGAADLQHLSVDEEPLYRHVARLAADTAVPLAGEAGFVVGATRPELLADLRERHPEVPFLVPGIGAQGGSAADVLAANADGPILINASRSILYASSGADFAGAAAEAAHRLRDELRGA